MNQKEILEAIQKLRKDSKKRQFNQTFDLVMNFKGLDLKNPDHNINTFLQLPHSKGKQNKIGVIVGKELGGKVKDECDEVIHDKDLSALSQDKKKLKKLAKGVDFFMAQADIMPKIATSLGRVLGPMGKMPSPKAGCIVPPTIPSLKPLVDKLRNTVKLQTKNEPGIKVSVGKEDMKDEEIAENILAIYNHIIHLLPQETQNIKNAFVKLTMGKSFFIGKKKVVEKVEEEKVVEKTKGKPKKEVKVEKKPKEKKKVEKPKVKKVKKDGA